MSTLIKLRRDTAANWTTANPVLSAGEVGIETDTRKMKFGDGVTAWNSVTYGFNHSANHQHGGTDEIATATPAANAIPKANSAGLLALGWHRSVGGNRFQKAGATNYTAVHVAGLSSGVSLTTLTLVANRFYAVPFTTPDRGATADTLQAYVTTGALMSNLRIGIYDNLSESGCYPGTLILDAGAFTSTMSADLRSASISQVLTPGKLMWAVVLSDGTPAIRAGSTNQSSHLLGTAALANTTWTTHIYATQTYGTLPSTFPTTGATAATGAFPAIGYTLST